MRKSANQLTDMLAEQEKIMGRKYVRSDDIPSSEDILGINGHDGKKFTFVHLMQCGTIDYLAVREWSKTPPSLVNMLPMFTPQLSEVYYVERKSTPRIKSQEAKKPTAQRKDVFASTMNEAPATPANTPEKRGRGRPKGSGKKSAPVSAKHASAETVKRGRGRPRKIAS